MNTKQPLIEQSEGEEALPDKDGGIGTTLFARPIRIKKIDDARRLLSRLILALQKKQIAGRDAKDLCYIVVSYVNVASETDLEKRVEEIEKQIAGKKGGR